MEGKDNLSVSSEVYKGSDIYESIHENNLEKTIEKGFSEKPDVKIDEKPKPPSVKETHESEMEAKELRREHSSKMDKKHTYKTLSEDDQRAVRVLLNIEGKSAKEKIESVMEHFGVSKMGAINLLADATKELPKPEEEKSEGGDVEGKKTPKVESDEHSKTHKKLADDAKDGKLDTSKKELGKMIDKDHKKSDLKKSMDDLNDLFKAHKPLDPNGRWVTIDGRHVHINAKGDVDAGKIYGKDEKGSKDETTKNGGKDQGKGKSNNSEEKKTSKNTNSHYTESSVNEAAKNIASKTGTRPEAVKKFANDNDIDIMKLASAAPSMAVNVANAVSSLGSSEATKKLVDVIKNKMEGKGSKDKESKPKHSQETIDKEVDRYKKYAASISMPSTFSMQTAGGWDKDFAIKKDSPILQHIIDKYGKTDGGKKRSLSAALEAFHKDAKSEALNSVKVSPEDQSRIDDYQKRIDQADKQRKQNNDINKVLRIKDEAKGNEKLKELGLSNDSINSLRNPSYGRQGVPSYVNQNLGGKIKNYKDQIEGIRRSSKINNDTGGSIKEGDVGVHGISFENNKDDQRVRLTFDGKPNAEARQALKRGGFRWSPKAGAWQRQNNVQGHVATKRVLGQLKGHDDIYKSIDVDLKGNIENTFDLIGL